MEFINMNTQKKKINVYFVMVININTNKVNQKNIRII